MKMAENRFVNSKKYKEDWFLDLSDEAKLFYYFLIEHADHGGFYKISNRHIKFNLSYTDEVISKCLEELADQIIWSDNKTTIYLKPFLREQNNYPLVSNNKAHLGAYKIIAKTLIEFKNNREELLKIPYRDMSGEVINDTNIGHILNFKVEKPKQ